MYCFCYFNILHFRFLQMYNSWYPIKDEINLSMLWCCLVIGFALYPLKKSLWYFKINIFTTMYIP